MIKIVTPKMKKSGGPGRFMDRLLRYMQDHEMVRVSKKGDIYFATVWLGDPLKRHKIVYRAASAYYDTNQLKRHGLNSRIAKAIKSADHVVYQTKFAKKLCQKVLGVKAKKHSIIHNGFDTSEYADLDPRKLDSNTFVACSNWNNKYKRGDSIIKAFNLSKLSDANLIMIGGGLSSTKNNNVKKVGALGMYDIMSYLKARPVFIHMCYAEACPNVVVEALSCGCPVICNNIGGTPEIVKEDGIIVNCDNPFVFRRTRVNIKMRLPIVSEAIKSACNKEWQVHRPDLSMEKCANEYLKVFMGVLK